MSTLKFIALIAIAFLSFLIVVEFILFFISEHDHTYLLLIFFKAVCLFWFLALFLMSCASPKVVYRDKKLTTPPDRYIIGTITNNKQALFEYGNALFTVARWQNWYNLNVGSNYYNYFDYTNIIISNDKKEISNGTGS